MTILDRVASAETSKNLAHKREFCDVDVIGAVGMAAIQNPEHLAIWRVKYLNDIADIPAAKRIFILWARRAMMRRGVNPAGASRLGVQTLTQWLDEVCNACDGQKYLRIEKTPSLSAKACPKCQGTGKNPIKSDSAATLEVVFDVIERADGIMFELQNRIQRTLGERE